MRRISLFAEDFGHEAVLTAFLDRFSREYEVAQTIRPYSVQGGHGRVVTELKQYLRELQRHHQSLPDLLVVGSDSNCNNLVESRQVIEKLVVSISVPTVCAVPDPHIERWLLLDSAAFKAVLGKGCNAPDQKCEKGRYKTLLMQAVRATGIMPLIGGMEHAESLVKAMDLVRMERTDDLGSFLKSLRAIYSEWARTGPTPSGISG
jgi:hypothetical protein